MGLHRRPHFVYAESRRGTFAVCPRRSGSREADAWKSGEGKVCMRKNHILFPLFYYMLYISAFTFGGGFVIITLMKRKFCDELHWMEEKEMLDITALAQSSPGQSR